MAKKIRNLNQLISEMEKVRDKANVKVAPKTKELMQKNVDKVVYDAYAPQDYERTGRLRKEISAIAKGDTIQLFNYRTASYSFESNRKVYEVVETGRDYIWGGGELDDRIGPRPFIQTTKEQLQDGLYKDYLVNEMKKQGFKIRK